MTPTPNEPAPVGTVAIIVLVATSITETLPPFAFEMYAKGAPRAVPICHRAASAKRRTRNAWRFEYFIIVSPIRHQTRNPPKSYRQRLLNRDFVSTSI